VKQIRFVKQFRKDLKKANKNPRHDTKKLLEAVEMLAKGKNLPDYYRPHVLSGNWHPMWECHIQPDFLLIYYVTDTEVCLHACGSHAMLFG